jgi:outer membrane receptor protein involved in Fe transport
MRILAVILCTAALWGQSAQFEIHGTVRDKETLVPLPGANVILTGTSLAQVAGMATDERGEFSLIGLPADTYLLEVAYIGYRTYERMIELGKETSLVPEINVELEVESILLKGYVITASRGRRERITDAPAATAVLSAAEIRRSTSPNMGNYFKHLKGVDFTASGIDAFNLSVRGFNTSFSSRLMTLVDGRRDNVPSLRLIAYNTIPTASEDIDQIEIVLGPSSSLYGPDAYAGVANIITKKPSLSVGGYNDLSIGNRDLRKWQFRYAGAKEKWGYKISFVDFSATDWRWVDPEEKKSHHRFWTENDGEIGAQLNDNTFRYDWIWDGYDIRFDRDDNGSYTDPLDSVVFAVANITADLNSDGLIDTADFGIENQRLDLRLDYDFADDHSIILSYGQAVASNINITPPARFLAKDWTYRYYQVRYIKGPLYAQVYLNTSNAGTTRNLRTGERIRDESTYFHLQLQLTGNLPRLFDSQVISGFDYQRTMPKTYGSTLPDGPAGRIQPESYDQDGIDNDGDGKIDEFAEGLLTTNEFGVYVQSTSRLTPQIDLVAASRVDLHSGLLSDKGIRFLNDPLLGGSVRYQPQFSPKIGLLWKPDPNQTFRLTAARAFRTPSSSGLYLRLHVGTVPPVPVMARGNPSGFHYSRDPDGNLLMYDLRAGSATEFRLAPVPEEAALQIPAILDRTEQWLQSEDMTTIDPVISEDLWTYEAGYVGIIRDRLRATFDLYYSEYSDFVSDLTWVTPLVMDTSAGAASGEVIGLILTAEHDGVKEGPGGYVVDIDKPPEFILTNVNYGRVSLGGFDISLGSMFSQRLWSEVRISYLGRQKFYNPVTRSYDPINAPRYKISGSATFTGKDDRYWLGLTLRHIPTFDWSAGIFIGTIPAYLVIDMNCGCRLNELSTLKLIISNLNNRVHREIVGGAKLGRLITLSLATNF